MKNEKNLFAEFKPSTYEEWYAEAVKLLKGAPFDKKMLTQTPEGITLKPIYNKEDMTFDVSLPGFDDYVRGTNAAGNKASPWKISQELCAGTPSEFNKKILDALNKGQTSIEIVLDDASAHAVDADKSEKCKVANKGLSISTAKDFDIALKGVETDCVDINIHTGSAAADIAAVLYASQKGKKLRGGIFFDPIGELAKTGKLNRSLDCAFDEMFATASYNVKNIPAFTAIGVDTMPYSSAGASAVEELAAAFATAVAYIRAMLERGLAIDEAASQIRFRVSLGGNFFMEIAKIRAARMLWAKIVSEFGGNEQSQKIKIGARTSVYNKTVFDPYVNMLRTATEAFSGVVGGVDSHDGRRIRRNHSQPRRILGKDFPQPANHFAGRMQPRGRHRPRGRFVLRRKPHARTRGKGLGTFLENRRTGRNSQGTRSRLRSGRGCQNRRRKEEALRYAQKLGRRHKQLRKYGGIAP